MKKTAITLLIPILAILVIRFAYRAITAPDYRHVSNAVIDASQDPEQADLDDAEPIEITFKDGHATLVPKATYRIATKICGKQRYRRPWGSLVAPYDLCLSWGRLATEDLEGQVKFSQDMRWYQYWVKHNVGIDLSYVGHHSANTHVLYADKNLRKAVARLKKGDVVEMTGYLIFLTGQYKGRDIWWNSSLSRTDSGKGSCEVFYLTSLQKGSKLYGTLVAED